MVISGTKNWSSTNVRTYARTKSHMEAGTLPKNGGKGRIGEVVTKNIVIQFCKKADILSNNTYPLVSYFRERK